MAGSNYTVLLLKRVQLSRAQLPEGGSLFSYVGTWEISRVSPPREIGNVAPDISSLSPDGFNGEVLEAISSIFSRELHSSPESLRIDQAERIRGFCQSFEALFTQFQDMKAKSFHLLDIAAHKVVSAATRPMLPTYFLLDRRQTRLEICATRLSRLKKRKFGLHLPHYRYDSPCSLPSTKLVEFRVSNRVPLKHRRPPVDAHAYRQAPDKWLPHYLQSRIYSVMRMLAGQSASSNWICTVKHHNKAPVMFWKHTMNASPSVLT